MMMRNTTPAPVFLLVVLMTFGIGNPVNAQYLGTKLNRIFLDPGSVSVVTDGYDDGDVISFILETTPRDTTGSVHGHAAWMTLYLPAGVEVVGAELVSQQTDGSYVLQDSRDPDAAFNGWGAGGPNGYSPATGTEQLGEGYVNQVQQDSGIFYSTDTRTALDMDGLDDTLAPAGIGAAQTLYNQWDFDQLLAFGMSGAPGNLSGNSGAGNTPLVSIDGGLTWTGTGAPVAGPDAYYSNDYNPDCNGVGSDLFVQDLQCVGPWQRIAYNNAKFGGSGAVSPATVAGAIQNNSVETSAGFSLSTDNPLPAATNAIRFVLGERSIGQIELARRRFRITDAADFISSLTDDTFCLDNLPGAASEVAAQDNNWRYYEPQHQCIAASPNALLFKQTHYVNGVPSNGGSLSNLDVVSYEISFTNTSSSDTLTSVDFSDTSLSADLVLVEPGVAGCFYSSYDASPGPDQDYDTGTATTRPATWNPTISVSPGETVSVFICAQVQNDPAKGVQLENEAQVDFVLPATGAETLTSLATGTLSNRLAGTVYDDIGEDIDDA